VVRINVEVLMVQVSSLQEISTTGVVAAIIFRATYGTPVKLYVSDQLCGTAFGFKCVTVQYVQSLSPQTLSRKSYSY
jgi:hypothetical protein